MTKPSDLSEEALEYYKKIASSLIKEPRSKTKPEDVYNYVFETLSQIETIVGDPEKFIQSVISEEVIIIQKPKKPTEEVVSKKQKKEKDIPSVGSIIDHL